MPAQPPRGTVEDDNLPEAMPTTLPPPLKKKGRDRFTNHRGHKLPSAHYAPESCPDPEKAWRAITLLSSGKTKKDTCIAVGICYSTLRRWEKSDWWDEMHVDVVRTMYGDLKAAALTAAHALLNAKDGPTVRFILERLDPQSFGPPKIQAEIRAENRTHIEVEGDVKHTHKHIASEQTANEIASLLQGMDAFKHVTLEDDECTKTDTE